MKAAGQEGLKEISSPFFTQSRQKSSSPLSFLDAVSVYTSQDKQESRGRRKVDILVGLLQVAYTAYFPGTPNTLTILEPMQREQLWGCHGHSELCTCSRSQVEGESLDVSFQRMPESIILWETFRSHLLKFSWQYISPFGQIRVYKKL